MAHAPTPAAARTVLVANPNSQNGALGRKWDHVSSVLRRELGAFEAIRTEAPGDATRLTRQALADGADRVVAIGGDGTINEVVNGFFDGDRPVAPDAALGVIPFGTGGDLRKTLRIPKDLTRAARALASGVTRDMDVGKLEFLDRDGAAHTRMFANIASFGISGLVDRLVNQSSKRWGGRISFFVSTLRAGFQYQNQRVRMTFDGRDADAVEMTIQTVAVANGRYFGGGMYIAPEAEIDDGYFDVVALGDMTLADMVLRGRRVYAGTHLSLDKVSHRRAKVVHAEPVGGAVVELDVDGETPGVLPATFTLLPRALRVVTPS